MTQTCIDNLDCGHESTENLDCNDQPDQKSSAFEATDITDTPSVIRVPNEIWTTILESKCSFPPEIFDNVMFNLIKNPNITSSHLFRADILIDSHGHGSNEFAKHVKAVFKPRPFAIPGWTLERTIVRQLIPRNASLDKPLVQTCLFFCQDSMQEGSEEHLIVYLPHIDNPDDIPFYHPAVSKLAFHHKWEARATTSSAQQGSISLSYSLFPNTELSSKLQRTALRLLQTVHKHGQGQLAGYEKRVHLDRIIPQKRYQDTYARLKAKYGRALADSWVEVTDPGKHVFEDIGIAAFLVELWGLMYQCPVEKAQRAIAGASDNENKEINEKDSKDKPQFPGFVDIGCGNGILTYILLSEGYPGHGFDARQRKTWSIFPASVQANLHQRLLVPQIFIDSTSATDHDSTYHNGIFNPGTFIISNHADELTAWTPLLAYINASASIAIPCCSHDLSGARFRAPATTKSARGQANGAHTPVRLPQQENEGTNGTNRKTTAQAAETGSLKRMLVQKKMASAYSTLCSYVLSLSEAVGFTPETEVLRIPSTRNQSVIGRRRVDTSHNGGSDEMGIEERQIRVKDLVEEELGKSIQAVAAEWIERAEKLSKKPGSGH